MATVTLDAMMRGGMYDQLGGGFHRYSTDERWLVPHFEKMLDDNAAREMLNEAGGFYSAQDADTEGEEGRYFVWAPEEIEAALASATPDPTGDAELLSAAYGVTARGNFEGKNILTLAMTSEEIAESSGLTVAEVEERLARAKAALLAARETRVSPGLDNKVLASWNGLMLSAFAEAARVLDRDDYKEIAERCADFVLEHMRTPEGRMLRSWPCGGTALAGYLEDHAAVAAGLLELYQTSFDPRWFEAARELAETILAHFADPAGGSVAAELLIKLAEYTGEERYAEAATAALAQVQPMMARAPLGFAHWLGALDLVLAPPAALAIVGEGPEEMLAVVRERWRPGLVVAAVSEAATAGGVGLLDGREALGQRATAYLCRGFACERPVVTIQALVALLTVREAPD